LEIARDMSSDFVDASGGFNLVTDFPVLVVGAFPRGGYGSPARIALA